MRKVVVEVKDCDIRRGIGWFGSSCPVARAIRRRLRIPLVGKCYVAGTIVSTPKGRIALPEKATKFICRFDAIVPYGGRCPLNKLKLFKPFKFTLEIP